MMKRTSIRGRIFKNNLLLILLMLLLTALIFNLAAGRYFQRSTEIRLGQVAVEVADLALQRGPEFFMPGPPPEFMEAVRPDMPRQDTARFYILLERAIRGFGTLQDVEYLLLDREGAPFEDPLHSAEVMPVPLQEKLPDIISDGGQVPVTLSFTAAGSRYVAVVQPVSMENDLGLGWVVLYGDMQQAEAVQQAINVLLLAILLFSALVTVLFSAHTAQRVCAPFAEMDRHLQQLGDHKYGERMELTVDVELQGLADAVNGLSERLALHDQAQKTFLQNVSHEFRTPLMAVQSHAEGMRHGVSEPSSAAAVILEETGRLTVLVENLLYLSRLEALSETYILSAIDLNDLAEETVARMNGMAALSGISLSVVCAAGPSWISADGEKLARALENLISNGIRHGRTAVQVVLSGDDETVCLSVADDGPGVSPEDREHIFERFYRGQGGVSAWALPSSER